MPYFSVIMPAFNREKIIGAAIESILNQTFLDFELIIVDDHSNDNTKKIITDFQDQRLRYFYLDENMGPGGARNFGIKKSESEIIVLADSDDMSYPHRLELTRQAFAQNPKINVVYGRCDLLKDNGTLSSRPTHIFSANLLKAYNFIANPTAAFRKSIYLQTNGYDTTIRTSEDYDLWLQFLKKGAQFYFIDMPLVQQKIHDNSITLDTQKEKRQNNLAYVRQKHNLKNPSFNEVKILVQDQKLLDFISTPGAQKFWFN